VLGDTHRLLVLTTNNLCLFLMPETSSNWHLPRRNFYATVHRGISIAAAENVLHKNIQIPASSAFWLTHRSCGLQEILATGIFCDQLESWE